MIMKSIPISHSSHLVLRKTTRNIFPLQKYIMARFATLCAVLLAAVTITTARETGICSFYGAESEIPQGHPTASGEGFDRFALKAAHKTLPFGTRIRVRNLNNGQNVVVTINDRGPFTPGRILDLTFGAFGRVANHNDGLFTCTYEILR